MTSVVTALLSLAVGATDFVSTDGLDDYAEQVAKVRKSCGPTAAWYCLRRLGLDADLHEVWQEASIGADGVSLSNLLDLFRSRGVSAQALVGDARRLASLPAPSILVVDETHCVVYEGVESDGRTARYFEPADGRMQTAPLEVIERSWSGEVIVFEPPSLSLLSFTFIALVGASLPLLLAGCWHHLRGRWQATPSVAAPGSPVPSTTGWADS